MRTYLEIAVILFENQVPASTDLEQFRAEVNALLVNHSFSPITTFEAFLVLQNLIWVSWCYHHKFNPVYEGYPSDEDLINISEFPQRYLGLSMHKAIQDKLSKENQNPSTNQNNSHVEQASGADASIIEPNNNIEESSTDGRTQEN